jgi:Immunoglobulin I-set domain
VPVLLGYDEIRFRKLSAFCSSLGFLFNLQNISYVQIRSIKYTLTIRNVTYADFGNYSCRASNNLGKDRHTLVLSGIPTVCFFDSVSTLESLQCPVRNDFIYLFQQPTVSPFRDQYNISWTVQSYSPIREYRLFYRKQSHKTHPSHLDHLDNSVMPVHQHSATHLFAPHTAQSSNDQWENVVIPEIYYDFVHNHLNNHQTTASTVRHQMNFLIKNLTPASNYEARVQARNDHGWNKLSNTFHFTTRSEGELNLTENVCQISTRFRSFPEYSVSPAMELELAYGKLSSSSSLGNCAVQKVWSQLMLCICCILFIKTS